MKRKRILSIMSCMMLLLFNPFCSAQAESNYSRLRANVPDSFVYETTTVYGNHISIDAPIILPEVSEISVLRVKWNINKNGSAGSWLGLPEKETDKKDEATTGKKKSSREYAFSFPLAEEQAPGSEVSLDEAVRAVLDILSEKKPDVDFEYYCGYAESGMYMVPNDITVDYDEISAFMASHQPIPGCEKGRYCIRFRQALEGVPVFFQDYFCISNSDDPSDPYPRIMASYTDSDNYKCYMETVHIDSTAAEDVSLLSYTDIENQIRKYIDLGLIQQIDKLELGYMLFYEEDVFASSPRSEIIMLAIPTWRVSGYFSFGAYEGYGPDVLPERTEWGAMAENKVKDYDGNDCMRFDAITGKSFFSYDNPAPRVYHLQEMLKHE